MRAVDTIPDPVAAAAAERAEGGERRRGRREAEGGERRRGREELMKRLQDQMVD
jgi:hypothetical protein